MIPESKNSADIVGQVLTQTAKLAQSRRRIQTVLVTVLVVAVVLLTINKFSSEHAFSALQHKSAEQTVAEVELRNDVNNLSARNKTSATNHTATVALLCLVDQTIPLTPSSSAIVSRYCPSPDQRKNK